MTATLKPLASIQNFLQQTALVWKIALGSSLSWELARWTGSGHPYLAPLTVILCLQPTAQQSVKLTLQRVGGTILGVLLVAFFAHNFRLNGWILGAALLVGASIAKGLKLSDKVTQQVALSVLFVLYFEPRSRGYAFDRAKDTVIGALCALVLMLFVMPPNRTNQALQAFQSFADQLSASMTRLAGWLQRGCPRAEGASVQGQVQTLLGELHQAMNAFVSAFESTRFNPYVERYALDSAAGRFHRLRATYAHLTALTRTLCEWSASGTMTHAQQASWAAVMQSLAAHVREWQVSAPNRTAPLASLSVHLQPVADPGPHVYPLVANTEVMRMILDLQPPQPT